MAPYSPREENTMIGTRLLSRLWPLPFLQPAGSKLPPRPRGRHARPPAPVRVQVDSIPRSEAFAEDLVDLAGPTPGH